MTVAEKVETRPAHLDQKAAYEPGAIRRHRLPAVPLILSAEASLAVLYR